MLVDIFYFKKKNPNPRARARRKFAHCLKYAYLCIYIIISRRARHILIQKLFSLGTKNCPSCYILFEKILFP
jgi:hypothetical protein